MPKMFPCEHRLLRGCCNVGLALYTFGSSSLGRGAINPFWKNAKRSIGFLLSGQCV